MLRLVGLGAGMLALALVCVVSGVALGFSSSLTSTGDSAAASIVTPSPDAPSSAVAPDPVDAPEPVVANADDLGAEPARIPSSVIDPIAWDGDPTYVSTVYPSTVKGLYGVGVLIKIEFASAVPDELKALLERAAVVEATKPLGAAFWSWPDDNTMAFRPREFWPAYTSVKVDFAWKKYGLSDYNPTVKFRIGRSQTLTVSANNLVGKVKRDGLLIRKVPTSLGKPGWETASGVKTIMERYEVKRMINPGPIEPYDVMVPYALRLTPSGEFLHAAPWNEYNLGQYSTSHGCTNLSYDDGQWFYERALEGDPVITKGTGVDLDYYEGPGALWNIDWDTWTANSRWLP